MNASLDSRVKVIVHSHVESKKGAVVHVERLELSRAGTALLTSTSESISSRRPARGDAATRAAPTPDREAQRG